MEDTISFQVRLDEPYAERLEKLREAGDRFAQDPIRQVAPNLIGEAAFGLYGLTRTAALVGNAMLHGALHIQRVK